MTQQFSICLNKTRLNSPSQLLFRALKTVFQGSPLTTTLKQFLEFSGVSTFPGGIEYGYPGSQNTRTSCNLADLKVTLNELMAISEYTLYPW
jgi:hypothetical protein